MPGQLKILHYSTQNSNTIFENFFQVKAINQGDLEIKNPLQSDVSKSPL